jgi:hypothetical protein
VKGSITGVNLICLCGPGLCENEVRRRVRHPGPTWEAERGRLNRISSPRAATSVAMSRLRDLTRNLFNALNRTFCESWPWIGIAERSVTTRPKQDHRFPRESRTANTGSILLKIHLCCFCGSAYDASIILQCHIDSILNTDQRSIDRES